MFILFLYDSPDRYISTELIIMSKTGKFEDIIAACISKVRTFIQPAEQSSFEAQFSTKIIM